MNSILIVEDDDKQLIPFSEVLGTYGYQILIASNGIDGFEIALKNKPDLMIVDLFLVFKGDQVDGFELIKKIRNHSDISNMGIIAWTSHYVRYIDEVRALKAGADDYIKKDIDIGVLQARIEALIRRKM